jgi:hypothetical protein
MLSRNWRPSPSHATTEIRTEGLDHRGTDMESPHGNVNWTWYMISLTPLISGALGPAATLLAISGCIDTWRALGLSDGSHINDHDPQWVRIPTLIAILVGVIANVLLLIRLLLSIHHPRHLQLWSIVLWILEGTIDIFIFNG